MMRTHAIPSCLLTMLLAGAVFADAVTVGGTVLGPDGMPVAGATVLAPRQLGDIGGGGIVATTTDAVGAFVLRPDSGTPPGRAAVPVLVRKDGFALAIGLARSDVPVILNLGDQPQTRSGVLLKPDGGPLGGGRVVASSVSGRAANGSYHLFTFGNSDVWEATADADGRFSFAGLPPGLTLGIDVTIDGYARLTTHLQDEAPVTLLLRPEAIVTGRVLVGGQPVPGIRVEARGLIPRGGGGTTVTGPDGAYTLRHLPAGQTVIMVRAGAGYATPSPRNVALISGRTVAEVDFSITPGGLIRGRVTSATNGKALAGAYVIASPVGEGGFANTQSGPDGTYELRLAPGQYRLACRGPGPEPPPPPPGPEVITVVEGGVMAGRDLQVKPPHKVVGQVLLPDGRPATGALLYWYGRNSSDERVPLSVDARFELVLHEVAATALGPDRVTIPIQQRPMLVVAREPQKNLSAVVQVNEPPAQLTIRLEPAAWAIVLVTDPQGQPLADIPVMALVTPGDQGSGFTISDVNTNREGLARFTALPLGCTLQFDVGWGLSHLVYRDKRRENDTYCPKAGEQLRPSPIVMSREGRSLNVFVGDADGKPVQGAQVHVEHLRRSFTTDGQGKVTLTGLAVEGRVALLATDPREVLCAAAMVDPDEGPWPGLLVKTPGRATGRLIDKATGTPLEGVRVAFRPLDSSGWWISSKLRAMQGLVGPPNPACQTNIDGRWQLGDLVPGAEYRLVVFLQPPQVGSSPGRAAGTFTAEGGPTVQDVGTMECERPAEPGG